ncbi:molybdenum cofactor guanylyltransferase MobA [Phyllobacterium leguminum]|uniref:Molybdenum cofactor guanylyltransferase n=1 Tax=Phyllobacterium leguminum TaxID=314237 RepID=A0A318T307_9HYPH|nr:molybdenum cofactor guanylyltransferase MobA [Phyllobacterium leguminum]PYE88278.1 molybdenum cofactor guanylyltransferase [Phyllobacterium leguminum]
MQLLGVILAGGRATRMGGGDKTLMPLGGKSLIDNVIERLSPQLPDIIINANGDPARFAEFGLPVVADHVPGYQGPLAGLHAAMRHATEMGATHIVTVAADTPFFPADLVSRLMDAQGDAKADIALAASGGNLHPVFGLWPVALEKDLAAFLMSDEKLKVSAWANRHRVAEAHFDPLPAKDGTSVDPFFNINTREDLALAEELLEKRAS